MPNANRNTEYMDESEGDGRKTGQKAKIQFVLPDCSFAINAFFNVFGLWFEFFMDIVQMLTRHLVYNKYSLCDLSG